MTEIVCKCGTSRLEDVQCAECGEYFRAGWIPVSERLPEDCVEVIVCEIIMDYECVSAGFYDEAGRQWFSNGDAADYVSHWMPLPPPPEAS